MINKILVPTDFSAPADNAAAYALQVARYLKCNIDLCHSFIVPADLSNADLVSWPLYDYDTLKEESTEQLAVLARKLSKANTPLKTPDTFKPVINFIAEALPVPELLDREIREANNALVIAGSSGAGAVTRFLAGSTTRRLIEAAAYPLLLVPPEYPFKEIRKIAFASDLSASDVNYVHVLAGFARRFDAEIVIVHVKDPSEEKNTKKANDFLLEVTSKINYDKIYFREFSNSSINEGLDWITEHGWVDLLAMVHRQSSTIDRILKGSHTKRQAGHLHVPMLVLPENLNPVFCVY